MRWEQLFHDLEAQLGAAEAADLASEVADRTRRESALLTVRDRALGSCGSRVVVQAEGAGRVDGVLVEVGSQWLLLAEDGGRDALVPLPAVLGISGLGSRSAPPGHGGQVAMRLGLGSALRALARDRAVVTAVLTDGSTVAGTLDRVGADFVELTSRDTDRDGLRPEVRLVPTSALGVVRSGP